MLGLVFQIGAMVAVTFLVCRCFGGTEGAQQAAGLRPEDYEVSQFKDENHGVQVYLSVIESPAMDSKKTELITAMLCLEM
jgi:hypothetical protein